MPSSHHVIVLTTLPAEADASAFARTLVGERLAACVNVLPRMQSIYRWQGAVEEAVERQVIIKTVRSAVDALERRIGELHTYEMPEILILAIEGGAEAYLNWLTEST